MKRSKSPTDAAPPVDLLGPAELPPPRFEYTTLETALNDPRLEAQLNGYGALGWLAFAVAPAGIHRDLVRVKIFFRREVIDTAGVTSGVGGAADRHASQK